MFKKLLFFIPFICSLSAFSQQSRTVLTLTQAIDEAHGKSIDAMLAKHYFLGSYWEYRSYKANYLPSLSLRGNIPSFDRSLNALQDPNTGEYKFLQNYVMRSTLALDLTQNIGLTGGTVSLSTGLERMDQFSPDRIINYNSSPISIILNQPIGAFNKLKWDRRIEPVKYERAKYAYLESMQSVTSKTVELFFGLLIAQQNLEMAKMNYSNTDTLYKISLKRLEIGAITQADLLQMELRLLNEKVAINSNQLQLNLAMARLRSYLRYKDNTDIELMVPDRVPQMSVDLDRAYSLAMNNTSFTYRQRIQQLEAERAVAVAKADRNPQIDLYARFGLNQVGSDIVSAYNRPLDQETVSLGVRVPIFDGGVARGRVKMSLSQKDVIEATLEKEAIDQQQDIYLKVMQFNNQAVQCQISVKADSVSNYRYSLSMQQFALGRLSVLEFNNAQSERNAAHNQLINELYNFWDYYYSIQRLTLYDFRNERNISADFDKIIE